MVYTEVSNILTLLETDILGSALIFGVIIIGVLAILAFMAGLDPKISLLLIAPAVLGIAGFGIKALIPTYFGALVAIFIGLALFTALIIMYLRN